MRKGILLFALLFSLSAHSQTGKATLTCTPPTLNTDGSAISAAQLPLLFKFYEGTVLGTYPNASTPQSSCGFQFTGLAPGTHFFVATATDARGQTSAWSMSAQKVIPQPTPQPPSVLTVTDP